MSIQEQIDELESKFLVTEDFEIKLDIRGKLHNLRLLQSGAKPSSSGEIECVGCGS